MRVELFLWVLVLIVSAQVSSATIVKPSKHKEKKEERWWDDSEWKKWFPEEFQTEDESQTNTVPAFKNKNDKSDSTVKKESDFSFDKSLSYKDDVDSFLENDKNSYLKKEEQSEKDWHAEFQKSFQDAKLMENVIDKKQEKEIDIFKPTEGGENKYVEKSKVPSGFDSFDSIVPEMPMKETDKNDVTKHESVKKDLQNQIYLKEFMNTKPDLKTSPNPPPLGLGDGKPLMVTPAGKKDDMKIKLYIESVPPSFCKSDVDCRSGRMCHEGVCMCFPDDACLKHQHPVCGSDGMWYPSHCELHRVACIHRVHIKIDRTRSCLKTHEDTPAYIVKQNKNKLSSVDAPIDPKVPSGTLIDSKEIYVGNYLKKNHDDKSFMNGKLKTVDIVKPSDEKRYSCDIASYLKFKDKLLLHHCNQFAELDCKTEVEKSRDHDYLALIFSYYDRDIDYYLEKSELDEMQKKEELVIMDTVCTLLDMLVYDDIEPRDDKISVTEFLKAFDKSEEKGSIEIDFQIIPTLATVGNGLELKCAILGGEDIVWKRYDTEINSNNVNGLTAFDDGALFFSRVGVHHIGNYSCSNRQNSNIRQIHVLKVQMPPIVRVSPVSQLRKSNADITVKCHAEGIPRPDVSWEVNEMDLPDDPKHFVQTDNNETLTIHNADYHRDTGAYTCIAKNQAGKAEDVASIFIKDMSKTKLYTSSQKSYGTFLVFHSRGYTAYRPQTCLMRREVRGKFGNFKFIPDRMDTQLLSLCNGDKCEWGTAVNVKDQFVFISQPTLNRVVVIETSQKWNPVQIIDTDHQPIGLYYIPHLDQVWVLCWNGRDDGSMKTIVVIRDTSQNIQHHVVHTQPVGNRFDLVDEIFMPPVNDLHHAFNFGYIVHAKQRGLFKLDLIEMKYVKVIDLSQFDCFPKSLAFVPIGGHVIVECVVPSTRKTLQIVLDYITDAIVSHQVVPGRPFVSPDSRYVVTVEYLSGKVSVSTVSSEGEMKVAFEVIVSTIISDVVFFPASNRKGYDFVMSSANTEDIIILCLNNGKVEKIKGTHRIGGETTLTPTHSKRTVVGGGVFGEYFMMTFASTISIIDGKHHHVKCEFKGVLQSKGVVFVEN